MSINFNSPMNAEAQNMIKEKFLDEIAAMDEKQVLLNTNAFDQRDLSEIANAANQPAQLELHGEGDIKTMSDGTRYKVSKSGWVKLETM